MVGLDVGETMEVRHERSTLGYYYLGRPFSLGCCLLLGVGLVWDRFLWTKHPFGPVKHHQRDV